MKARTRWIVGGGLIVVLIGGGAGLAMASRGDDTETPITGPALAKASAAALAHTGGGRVTETEAGDEDAYYEVEVTLDDGRQVDVHLDRDFMVVNAHPDQDGADEDTAGDSDDGDRG
jgi:hypothetical protein